MKSGARMIARGFALICFCLAGVLFAAPASLAEDQTGGPNDLSFFIGEWDIVSKDIQRDGTYAESRAKSHAYPFLDGSAIMDEWRSLDADGNVVFAAHLFAPGCLGNKNGASSG